MIWTKRYKSPGSGWDSAYGIAVSPDGTRVYVTGNRATIAYDASSGAETWIKRGAEAVTVSPDGATVYVTGSFVCCFATVAYDASTGEEIWTVSGGSYSDYARALAVSPDGTRVFVSGDREGPGPRHHYLTVAYDASTGAPIWTRIDTGPRDWGANGVELAVNPDGTRVYVVGASPGSWPNVDYGIIAYGATTGARLWHMRYDGPAHLEDSPRGAAVSADGTRLYVTGKSEDSINVSDFATVAYDRSGSEIWVKRYDGPANLDDVGNAVTVSPDGVRVYVTGGSFSLTSYADYLTIAYEA